VAAYVIVDIEVQDAERYGEYKKLAEPTVALYGGRYVVRGGAAERLEGERVPGRIVVLEFPSVERAKQWWDSAEYTPARALRHETASTQMIVVQGV
jgi:uncharacterized protein (DUF1330 family)